VQLVWGCIVLLDEKQKGIIYQKNSCFKCIKKTCENLTGFFIE